MPRRRNATRNNSPSQEVVQAAVGAVEDCLGDLIREKQVYAERCKLIRTQMAAEYEMAKANGVKPKLLKKMIKERDLHRKLSEITAALAADERNELEMLRERLGDFANSPLGGAALTATITDTTVVQSSPGPMALTGPDVQ